MFSEKVTVSNPTGLHARPASQLVELCKEIPDDILMIIGEKKINPKSILGILGAGMKCGTEVTIELEGDTAEENGHKIVDFINNLVD